MKDILKMVYGSQKEVKLESQKIELGSINELKSMLSSNESEMKNFEAFKKEFERINTVRDVNSKETSKSLQKTASVLDNFNKKTKELGLEARDVKEYVELSKSFSLLNSIVADYNTKYKFK